MSARRELVFVSTRFLFPVDSGGKIRTTQVLRGMKGGGYSVTLVSPGTPALAHTHARDLESVCDRFEMWAPPHRGALFHFTRLRHLASSLPIPVRTDLQSPARKLVARLLERKPAVAVFDFAHAAVLMPVELATPSVLFTHNVEAEIFKRHVEVASNSLAKTLWRDQYRKMVAFEKAAVRKFDVVVAVSERDGRQFSADYGGVESVVIPTGVDLDFFSYAPPERARDVVFCGSMDWLANQDAVTYLMDEIWPHIAARAPDATMTIIGRAPPSRLVDAARARGLRWRFTGFVDDVRPHVHGSTVSVVPLRIGGGTRLKIYEAMAMGSPVVSTAIGAEGLPVQDGVHYVRADGAREFANAVVGLVDDTSRRHQLAATARAFVEEHFSFRVAARVFEQACEIAEQRYAAIARTAADGPRPESWK